MTDTRPIIARVSSHLGTLLRRISYAVSIAVLTWLIYDRSGLQIPAFILDLPVAVAGRLTGGFRAFTGIALIFNRGVGEFMTSDRILLWHLRATILVYVPLFYAWDLLRLLRAKRGTSVTS